VEFELLLSAWKSYEKLEHPLPMPIDLWTGASRRIWVSNKWGPAVPYFSVDHHDGNFNHGYLPLKGNPGAAGLIPETQGWPELRVFLETLNAAESPIESVGCERGYFPGEEGSPAVKLGSYIDFVFTEAALNDRPENLLVLAWHLAQSVEDCEKWWASVSFTLQRLRGLAGASKPWGLMLNVTNYGHNEEEARKLWG
jgi:hypothetical protein